MSYGLDIAEGDRAEILLALWDDTLYGIGKVYQNLYNPDFWSAASDKFTGVGPQVIVLDRDTDGKLYMLLASYGLTTQSVKYMYHDGSAWSTAVDLFSFDNNILEALDIAPVSNNTSHITWGEASLGTFYVFGSSLGWSEPMPIDLLADRGHAQDQQATAFNTYYYGCQMKADSDSGIHMVFSNSEGVFYKRFVPPEHVTKRYYAGGQLLATRVDGTLYYGLNDPTGTSFTVTDDAGGFVGRIVYDGYGAELVNTLPAVLGQTLPGAPDAATGLVHQGNGRYYDPRLGRPLQPNRANMPATLPQALNRYTAMPFGQPGVFEAANNGGLHPVTQATVDQIPGLIAGLAVEKLALRTVARTVYKSIPTGIGLVELEGTMRHLNSVYSSAFLEIERDLIRPANGWLKGSLSYLFKGLQVRTVRGRMVIGTTLDEAFASGQSVPWGPGVTARLLRQEFVSSIDDLATKASLERAELLIDNSIKHRTNG